MTMKTLLTLACGLALGYGASVGAQPRRPAWHPLPAGIESATCYLHFANGDFQSVEYTARGNPVWGKTTTRKESDLRQIVDRNAMQRQEAFHKTAAAYVLHGKDITAVAKALIALEDAVQLQDPAHRGMWMLGVRDAKTDQYRPLTEDDIMMFRAGVTP